MPDRSSRVRRRSTKGIALIFTSIMLVFIIPLIGLSVDAGILYAVRAKLSMACDAGALAGARALSRGLDGTTQQSNAKAVAKEYLLMNFPNGYFGVTVGTPADPVVDETVSNQRSVTVSHSVTVPTYFMNWLRIGSTTVSSTATAVRRDVNVMVVMDRSGSLANSGSCAPLQAAAINFVNRFANGRDNVGLVTFATSSRPDFPIANNFLSASPSIPTIIGSVTCTGATSSAQGLWQGYQQLVALNQPNALNVLLFFTDGQPTALTASFPIKNTSPCSSKTAKTGVLTSGFSGNTAVVTWGLALKDAGAQPMSSDFTIGPAGDYANCSYASNWSTSGQNITDITYIPATDYYGNAMNTNYQSVTYYDGNGNINLDPVSVVNASINAADSAGYRIRTSSTIPGIYVYSIGLGNSGGVPDDFLERVANDPRASNYDSSKVSGFYIYAPTSADLSDAFSRIASQILHLSK